jgi:PHD/YefM family antitoxin component YafN of YafNO toxin-antitoxin module
MKTIALSAIKEQLSKYLRFAEKEEVVSMRHGKPAGVLVGFRTEDDWFDYRLRIETRVPLAPFQHALRALK